LGFPGKKGPVSDLEWKYGDKSKGSDAGFIISDQSELRRYDLSAESNSPRRRCRLIPSFWEG
jgi:hypothetical protein